MSSDERSRENWKNWYAKNKDNPSYKKRQKDHNNRHRIERREWWNSIVSKTSCAECGENHISTLVFHHNNPEEKELDITKMVHSARSEDSILREAAKCTVLCHNCHRKLHWRLRQEGKLLKNA